MEDRNVNVGGISDEILDKRLEEIARKRKELQHVEIELRVQAIARSEMVDVESRYQLKIKEHLGAASSLKEQLGEREKYIQQLEMKLEEKDRELHAVKLDNETAWAKDDLLREQNKELATFRRELDNSEAERAQRLQQMHDLQEHIQEKESQILQLEEQNRTAQETLLFKDEKLREAQAWIARVQDMDALQSTALHAQLRDRTEQFNQYWIGLQRQFAEVERHHLQTIQQLQLELAEARDQNGDSKESVMKVAPQKFIDSSIMVQSKGNQISMKNVGASNGNLGLMSNDNLDGLSYPTSSSVSSKTESASGVSVALSSILGMSAFIPPNQMTAAIHHPFVMHPQSFPQSVSSANFQISQPLVGHVQPMSTISAHQHWQFQQAIPDVSQHSNQTNEPTQPQQNLSGSDAHYNYDKHINQQQRSGSTINGSSNKEELAPHESNGNQYQASVEAEQASNANMPEETSNANAPFHPALVFASPVKSSVIAVQEQMTVSVGNQSQVQPLAPRQEQASIDNISTVSDDSKSSSDAAENNEKVGINSEPNSIACPTKSVGPTHSLEPALLDERSLLACIVRAIPSGSDKQIRISTTLPNRLAKMLAPLHWHDYKKHYGKLDDFVARHPELFVIKGDSIHLCEGAQEIISATTAHAKVAAAVSSAPRSSMFSSVALTPISQNHNNKTMQSQQPPNGVSFNVTQGMQNMNISDKSKNFQEVNGLVAKNRHAATGVNKGLANDRISTGGKQQARSAGASVISRR